MPTTLGTKQPRRLRLLSLPIPPFPTFPPSLRKLPLRSLLNASRTIPKIRVLCIKTHSFMVGTKMTLAVMVLVLSILLLSPPPRWTPSLKELVLKKTGEFNFPFFSPLPSAVQVVHISPCLLNSNWNTHWGFAIRCLTTPTSPVDHRLDLHIRRDGGTENHSAFLGPWHISGLDDGKCASESFRRLFLQSESMSTSVKDNGLVRWIC